MTTPIYPIDGRESQLSGCGTMIGDFFVTAGHVIDETIEPYIVSEGKRKLLDDSRKIFCANESDNGGLDLAVYRIPELRSDLQLSKEMLGNGTILKSVSYILSKRGCEDMICDVTISNIREGHYFGATTSIKLKAGCSGSPIISGNKVVGIMCKGNIDDEGNQVDKNFPINFCVFLSSVAILNILDC